MMNQTESVSYTQEQAHEIRQLIHDIRSPIAVLKVVSRQSSQLPEKTRSMIDAAVGRIQNIFDDLGNRTQNVISISLNSLIEFTLSQKQAEYSSDRSVHIHFETHLNGFQPDARIESTPFCRLLSNLIDNAVHSTGSKGFVKIRLCSSSRHNLIEIIDNGKGIPQDVLPFLGQRGFSYDKPNGSGLGLFHANTQVKKWNGRLKIRSKLGLGTKVTLLLPRAMKGS